jgi:hypothetical protein
MPPIPIPIPPTQQHAPPAPAPLSQSLKDAIRASSTRAEEGQRIFAPIATLWDDYLQSDEVRKLPVRLRKPLLALCQEISRTATRHFDAYIKGTRPSSAVTPAATPAVTPPETPPLAPTDEPALPIPRPLPPSQGLTYAQQAARPAPPLPPPTQHKTALARKAERTPPKTRTDTRLFLRISQDHPAREAGSFAMLTAIKRLLEADSKALREVQEVKTGFALCTSSPEALATLNTYTDAILQLVPGSTLEAQQQWTSYRLHNIPRTVRTLDTNLQITNSPVTDEVLGELIHDATGQGLVRAVETRASSEAALHTTTWLACFRTEGHSPLPRTLRILGTVVIASAFVSKPKAIQCTRCYQWHNSRECIRPQRCRLCGANHPEAEHTSQCNTSQPHSCPPRCLNCGGPHTADDSTCLLRPTRGPKTGSEKAAIRGSAKPARIRACQAAGCSKGPRISPLEGVQEMDTTSPSPSPITPTRTSSARPAMTPIRSRYIPRDAYTDDSPLTRPSFNE